jgi:dolichyl-diphosphooligosaccharide--protein glycosyltransferase/undecaprenyl-diphosphooligosaccharide--protein glycosyltransferase
MGKKSLDLGQVTTNQMLGLMLLAYAFSFAIRLIWVWQFQGEANYMWNNELMINTNDGYFFAAGAQQALEGLHMENPRVFGLWDYGVIFFTTLFVKITPFSLETVTLYMPSVISSLVVIPMILIARLYKQTMWGFFAALLGSITWSYYNRTMVGYYDTDMFSAMAPMFILFFLLKSTIDFNLRSAFYASLAIVIYPFLYDQGLAIVYGMGIIYAMYMVWYHRDEPLVYASLILIFLSLLPLPIERPFNYLLHFGILFLVFSTLKEGEIKKQSLQIGAGILFLLFLYFGNVFGLIWAKVFSYIITGTSDEGLHFYAVNQTVREAGSISFATFSNRISGSGIGLLLAFVGYIVLVIRHRAFILALPLVGIGIFALFGGLRFTVYAVPIAAMSAVYLFWVIAQITVKERPKQYLLDKS